VFSTHYLRKLCEANPRLQACFYVRPDYIEELRLFVPELGERLCLYPLDDRPAEAVNCHINADGFYQSHPRRRHFAAMYVDFFKHLSGKLGVLSPIASVEEMLLDSPALEPGAQIQALGSIDWLVINSPPLSGQCPYVADEWNSLIRKLVEKGERVVTTAPSGIESARCTLEFEFASTQRGNDQDRAKPSPLPLVAIGQLATISRNVAGVHTGPLIPCLNRWAARKVEHWYILDSFNHFFFNDRFHNCRLFQNLEKLIWTDRGRNPFH
jgi:hypothetical protein